MPTNLLEGVKVADFSWIITGPVTTKTLADCGAEVVKIEGRSKSDLQRTTPPFKDTIQGVDRAGSFLLWNTGKLSLALNLTSPKGLDVAKRLVAWSDIVIENFAGGVMKKMGLGYEELKKINPDIIMLSTCMQGQTGPFANQPGTGFQLTSLCGFSQITGWPDRLPPAIGPYTDFVGPLFNVFVVLAALDYRDRTGKGQYIDMAQYENGVHIMAPLVLDYAVNKRIATRMGNRHISLAPHGAFPCRGKDRWCAIAVGKDEEWESLCKLLDYPEWTKGPRFATLLGRKENEDELDKLLSEWTIKHSPEEVMTRLQAAGVPAGIVATGDDLMEKDPQVKHRRFFRELDHPIVTKYRAPGPQFHSSKVEIELKRSPLFGEHNEYVLKELLHMSDEEIAELILAGVIE